MQPEPLYALISANFAAAELELLSAELGLDYEELAGSSKKQKALELQQYMGRRGRLHELLATIYRQRPHLDLKPYLYLLIAEEFSSEQAMVELLEGFGLTVRDFGGREKFAWGSARWREHKAQALQAHMEANGQVSDLLAALMGRAAGLDLAFYEPAFDMPLEAAEEGETSDSEPLPGAGPTVVHYHISSWQGDMVQGDKREERVNTGGGSYVAGSVETGGGDFAGRDVTTGQSVKTEDQPEEIEVVELRVDAAVPDQVVVGQTFDLAVSVRQPGAPLLSEDDLSQVRSGDVQVAWPETQDYVRLKIQVSAPECEIHGPDRYSFRLYEGRDSPVFYFQLTPRREGEVGIVVTIYQEDDWLGGARIRTLAREQVVGEVRLGLASQVVSKAVEP